MTDFERLRATMVDNQIRTRGVTNQAVVAQMAKVPRERFVPVERQSIAYIDDLHWFANGAARRFIMPPATLARLLQLAEIGPDDAVLDIGAATGYGTAVMAGLAASVVGLEADADLAAQAADTIRTLGLTNASIIAGDLAALRGARFDVILVEGAVDSVPAAWLGALNDGGRLIAVIRQRGVCVANVFVKTGSAIAARGEFDAVLPPLQQAQPEPHFVF